MNFIELISKKVKHDERLNHLKCIIKEVIEKHSEGLIIENENENDIKNLLHFNFQMLDRELHQV